MMGSWVAYCHPFSEGKNKRQRELQDMFGTMRELEVLGYSINPVYNGWRIYKGDPYEGPHLYVTRQRLYWYVALNQLCNTEKLDLDGAIAAVKKWVNEDQG